MKLPSLARAAVLCLGFTACVAEVGVEADAELSEQEQELFGWCFPESSYSAYSEVTVSRDAYRGSPAWANDGSSLVLAAWQGYERRRGDGSDDPCAYAKRNYRFQLFAVAPGSRVPSVDDAAWMPGLLVDLYYEKSAGYALAKVLDESLSLMRFYRLALDARGRVVGAPLELGSQLVYQADASLYRGDVREIVPSPDGSTAADVSCHVSDETGDGGYRFVAHPSCTVRFLDMRRGATPVGRSWSLELGTLLADYGPGTDQKEGVMWTPAGTLLVTDQEQTAFVVGPHDAPRPTALPGCGGPNTTSSRVSAQGTRIGVSYWFGYEIETVAATEHRFGFGCVQR